jgi:hypothetical protein
MSLADAQFSRCQFLPWVGPRYEVGVLGGLRVLILGESHYSPNPEPDRTREVTRAVVSEELDGTYRHRFLARVGRAVLGRGAPDIRHQLAALWNGVAFYNYVQEYVGTRPKDRPTPGMWKSAEPAFSDVLTALRPDLVIACGRQLYDHVKSMPGLTEAPRFGADQYTHSRELLVSDTHRGILGCVYHPASYGFSSAKWHARVSEYVVRAHLLRAGAA